MPNLLQKASIVLTPTAYDDGKVLCAKPSEPPYGDFDFSRNSAATRVNAQGLVENVQILSGNLVQNGDFSELGAEEVSNGSFSQESAELVTNGSFDTDTNWIHRTSSSVISNGTLSWDGTQVAADDVFQQKTGYVGKFVKMTITISAYTQGSVFLRAGSSQVPTSHSSIGTFTEIFLWLGNDYIYVKASDDFIGSIDSVSVKEVGQDWTFGTGWSIGEDKAVANTTGSTNGLLQTSTITSGKIYKATFEVLDYQSGSVRINLGGAGLTGVGNLVSANGVYTQYITSDGVDVYMQGRVGFNGSITNLSVIEITDDTNLPRINYEGFSYQDALGSELVLNGDFSSPTTIGWSDNYLCPFIVENNMLKATAQETGSGMTYKINGLTIGTKYVISWDYINGSGALPKWRITNSDQSALKTYSDNSNYYYFIPTATTANFSPLYQCGTAGTFYFDNVSVKEYLGQEVVPDSGCGSWLFEPQSTNLVTYSEDFSQWLPYQINTPLPNQGTSPDGNNNATKIFVTINRAKSVVYKSASGLGNITRSVFAKKGSADYMFFDVPSSNAGVWFNLSNGEVGTINSGTATIEDYGNGWYRCSCTANWSSGIFAIGLSDADNSTAVTANKDILIWGAQTEALSYPTSYIPTSGTSVTRNQDVCTNGGSLASINSTEGVLYAEIAALADDGTSKKISLNNGSSALQVAISYHTTSNLIR